MSFAPPAAQQPVVTPQPVPTLIRVGQAQTPGADLAVLEIHSPVGVNVGRVAAGRLILAQPGDLAGGVQ